MGVYYWEGLLSEGFLRLTFGGLIFERAYFGGGNFTVLLTEINFFFLNPIWQEADQLAIYKRCRGIAQGTTDNKSAASDQRQERIVYLSCQRGIGSEWRSQSDCSIYDRTLVDLY